MKTLTVLIICCLLLSSVSAQPDGPEPLPTQLPCWGINPNRYPLRSFSVQPASVSCIYGVSAATPCQMTSPNGYALKRAVIKPDGRVKCVYEDGAFPWKGTN